MEKKRVRKSRAKDAKGAVSAGEGAVFTRKGAGSGGVSLEKMREVARLMWTVEGKTLPEIALKVGKGLRTIEKWRSLGGWSKDGRGALKVRELTQKNFIEELARQGMDSQRMAELLIEGMTVPMKDNALISNKGVTLKAATPDYKTRHSYQKDALGIAGVLGNAENASGEFKGSINIQVNIPTKKD